MKINRDTSIGYALSGGGALGAAHVGVLEVLDARGIRPALLVGTSAGAIIGSVYAAGGMVALNDFFLRINRDVIKKFYLRLGPQTLFRDLAKILKEYLPARLEQFPIPMFITATNVADGQRAVFSTGDPIAAILASSAYPGVFAHQPVRAGRYIDGGLTGNLPADVAREHGAGFVIGSSMYNVANLTSTQVKKLNRVTLAMRALDIIEHRLSEEQVKLCDFCFQPPVEVFSWYQLTAIDRIRETGRQYAVKQIRRLQLPK